MQNSIRKEEIIRLAKQGLKQEGKAVSNLANILNENFLQAIEIIQNCQGKVVVAGLGKGGRVGTKIAASLSSLGTPAFFLHADEALTAEVSQEADPMNLAPTTSSTVTLALGDALAICLSRLKVPTLLSSQD